MLINGGTATKLVIKDITGEIWFNLQIIWDKYITQKDLRFAVRIILSKLGIGPKIELAIISIVKKSVGEVGSKNVAVDLIEPDEQIQKDKITKWKMIQQWNNSLENVWLKYEEIDPKFMSITEKHAPYNIINEFQKDNLFLKTIEIMIWEPKNVDLNIKDLSFERFPNDVRINKGKQTK